MIRKKKKGKRTMSATHIVEIPIKLPSFNEYANTCRYNRYAGAKMKKDIQNLIAPYLIKLPKLNRVKIDFEWQEGNKRRDLDNISFSKKFILDTLVVMGKLKDDNRNNVCAFTDTFTYGKEWKVVLNITEVPNEFKR